MSDQKVKIRQVVSVSATVVVDNSGDENRKYDVSAHAKIEGQNVVRIESGVVCVTGTEDQVADFNIFHESNQSITYRQAMDPEAMCDVTRDVMICVAETKAMVAGAGVMSLIND